METKFTPGPYVVDGLRVLATDERSTVIAEVTGSEGNEYAIADAHLLATAPELYETASGAPLLHTYYGQGGFDAGRFFTDYEAWLVRRETALRKARGEPQSQGDA